MNALKTTPTLATVSALAAQAVKRPKSGPIQNRKAKAEQLYDALDNVDKYCCGIIRENAAQARTAETVQEIAQEAMSCDRAGLKDHQKIGAFQGALEVIAAVNGSITPGVIAKAAENVISGQSRLYFLDGPLSDNPEKQESLTLHGLEGIDQLAKASFNQPVRNAVSAGWGSEGALYAVSQLGEIDPQAKNPFSIELLGKIADKALKEQEGTVYDPKTSLNAMNGSLKVISRFSMQLDEEKLKRRHLGFALGQIAEQTLQKNRLTRKQGVIFHKTVSALSPAQQVGNCQGALTVLSELSQGSRGLTVKNMAGSLLSAEDEMHLPKKSQTREKNDQMYLSGFDALKTYARGEELRGSEYLDDQDTPEKIQKFLNRKWNSWS